MHNIKVNSDKIPGVVYGNISEKINEVGNCLRQDKGSRSPDSEVMALSHTSEYLSIDFENYSFPKLNKECLYEIENMTSKEQRNKTSKESEHYVPDKFYCASYKEYLFTTRGTYIHLCQSHLQFVSNVESEVLIFKFCYDCF
jgi:hypothetical protein